MRDKYRAEVAVDDDENDDDDDDDDDDTTVHKAGDNDK